MIARGLDGVARSALPADAWSSTISGGMLLLSGLACVALALRRPAAGQVMSFLVFLLAGLMGLAHVFPAADLYAYMPGTGVAIPTILALLAISASQLTACRRDGIAGALSSRSVVGRAGRRLLFAGGAAVVVLALAVALASRVKWMDAESAVVLVGWLAAGLLAVTLWGLAVAVDRNELARISAERERDQVRDMLIAALTHDLRTPLQAATTWTALLERTVDDPQGSSAILRLQRSHRRLDRLLRSLLDSLSLDSGRPLSLSASSFAMEHLVAEIVADSAQMLAPRVVLEGAAQGWWDRDALFRVLENLILNAVKYGDPGAPIECRIAIDAGDRAVVAVANRGLPIPPSEWESIFEPFTRGRDALGKPLPGWGVGLAFARAVARRHGGDIRVAASGPEETVFELKIPRDARMALRE